MRDPAQILVIRYSALGDVVLATSVLEPLRARFPAARIEWVTDALYAPLLEGLPEIAWVHRLGRDGADAALPLASRLRGRFDVVIDLQNKLRSAVVARAAAPLRTAFRRRTALRALMAVFGSDPPLVRAHATQLYAEALAPLGVTGPGKVKVSLRSTGRVSIDQELSLEQITESLGAAHADLVRRQPVDPLALQLDVPGRQRNNILRLLAAEIVFPHNRLPLVQLADVVDYPSTVRRVKQRDRDYSVRLISIFDHGSRPLFRFGYGFGDLWPILLIVIGLVKVASAMASTEGHTGP